MTAESRGVREAADLLVQEHGFEHAERRLQREFREREGAELNRVKAALGHIRKREGGDGA